MSDFHVISAVLASYHDVILQGTYDLISQGTPSLQSLTSLRSLIIALHFAHVVINALNLWCEDKLNRVVERDSHLPFCHIILELEIGKFGVQKTVVLEGILAGEHSMPIVFQETVEIGESKHL